MLNLFIVNWLKIGLTLPYLSYVTQLLWDTNCFARLRFNLQKLTKSLELLLEPNVRENDRTFVWRILEGFLEGHTLKLHEVSDDTGCRTTDPCMAMDENATFASSFFDEWICWREMPQQCLLGLVCNVDHFVRELFRENGIDSICYRQDMRNAFFLKRC